MSIKNYITIYLCNKVYTKNISLIPDNKEETNNVPYAWINIRNNEELDLTDCYAELKTIKIKLNGDWIDFIGMNPTHSKLTWPEFTTDQKVIVRRNSTERINIAKAEIRSDKIYFIFRNGDKEAISEKEFYIEVGINGELNNRPIKELVFKGFIKYNSGFVKMNSGKIETNFSDYHKLVLSIGEL